MTFETFIPPRAGAVLELTGEVPEASPTGRENFLAIRPDCEYRVAADLTESGGNFDAILAHSPLFGTLDRERLIGLIKRLGGALNAGGILIFLLDNIAYVENVAAILAGQPPKFKTTLTRLELENAVAAAGLRRIDLKYAARRLEIDKRLTAIAQTDLTVFTYILTAMNEEPPPRMLIQTLLGETKICAPVRIHMPNSFFVTEPNVFIESQVVGKPYTLHDNRQFKDRVFINQRVPAPSFQDGIQFFNKLVQSGYLSITERDDHPLFWRERYERNGWINFIATHGIQTSTDCLADFFREFNPNVKVFPNQLHRLPPPRDFDDEQQHPDQPVTIFFGALNRESDFMEILPALNKTAKRYGDRVAFSIIARREIFDAIESGNKTYIADADNIRDHAGQLVPYAKYQAAIRSADIALLPLRDTPFNRAKSDLKFLECAGNGAVALASPVVYSSVVRDGTTGFLYRDGKEFADKLAMLIENGDKRREVAEAAYRYVRDHRLLSRHYGERLAWYREQLAKLPELNAACRARIERAVRNFRG